MQSLRNKFIQIVHIDVTALIIALGCLGKCSIVDDISREFGTSVDDATKQGKVVSW